MDKFRGRGEWEWQLLWMTNRNWLKNLLSTAGFVGLSWRTAKGAVQRCACSTRPSFVIRSVQHPSQCLFAEIQGHFDPFCTIQAFWHLVTLSAVCHGEAESDILGQSKCQMHVLCMLVMTDRPWSFLPIRSSSAGYQGTKREPWRSARKTSTLWEIGMVGDGWGWLVAFQSTSFVFSNDMLRPFRPWMS